MKHDIAILRYQGFCVPLLLFLYHRYLFNVNLTVGPHLETSWSKFFPYSMVFIVSSRPFSVGFPPVPVTDSSRSPGPWFKLPETLADSNPLLLLAFASSCSGYCVWFPYSWKYTEKKSTRNWRKTPWSVSVLHRVICGGKINERFI